ncbi:hypothetical protein NUJ28_07615 [Burkholderia multivorans]|uniref:hypothetical protein n=1 Tax=Burkholderia multivorans TaxID=87883 RepID=UPI0021D96198|nr:hypothetical protein [Burkholderia multivorans]UXZ62572.1 hypothetical protein NUJ28_07615 [Burkholderia multivorans]
MNVEEEKRAFFEIMKRTGDLQEEERAALDRDFEEAFEIAVAAKHRMPGIGFMSARHRLNAFLAVCRHIDDIRGAATVDVVLLSLMILRVRDKAFLKAITMFEIRAPRFDLHYIVGLPKTARDYLATMRGF